MDNNAVFNGKGNDYQLDIYQTSACVRRVDAANTFHEKKMTNQETENWNKTRIVIETKTRNLFAHTENAKLDYIPQKYGYMFRPKSYWELISLGFIICGIEFCYAAETAFVTPILLGLGFNIKFVTMIWCLSPLIELILTPILGSMSDSCESSMGRRRPFILLYSIGILSGLIIVSNGHLIGLALGDHDHLRVAQLSPINLTNNNNTEFSDSNLQVLLDTVKSKLTNEEEDFEESQRFPTFHTEHEMNSENQSNVKREKTIGTETENSLDLSSQQEIDTIFVTTEGFTDGTEMNNVPEPQLKRRMKQMNEETAKPASNIQPWSIAFTVIGTMLLDFCSDACQSPSRTYMLDVSIPDDHAAGLSTFTLMAGLGGAIGYMMGAIQWEDTFLGHLLGSQVSVVFTIVTVVFIICLLTTICKFPEIPLSLLRNPKMFKEYQKIYLLGSPQAPGHEMNVLHPNQSSHGVMEKNNEFGITTEGAMHKPDIILQTNQEMVIATENGKSPVTGIDLATELTTSHEHPTLLDFLKSIVHMPRSLKILCLTNLFGRMSVTTNMLYFTDFVGECVFGGDPQAPEGTEDYSQYNDGVRYGCWGLSMCTLSCAAYSCFIEALIKKIGAKPTYIGGHMVYLIGMAIMAATRHKLAVILLSTTTGIMYATVLTLPYLLMAHYHCTNKFSDDEGKTEDVTVIRGIGTDVATVSSMLSLGQFILSMSMGSIVEAVGSKVAIVSAASIFSAFGVLCARQVLYLDL